MATYTNLSTKAIGSTVKLKVKGVTKEFIVVHQGKPSSLYDNSCNGTWVLMKDHYEKRQWHSSDVNRLENSTVHTYLNGDFLKLFDSDIQTAIKRVKIPYRSNGGSGGTNQSGANGLSTKIFLLSGYEVGLTTNDDQNYPVDGARLSYFGSGEGTAACNRRIAYLNGTVFGWWLRSPYTSLTNHTWYINTSGSGNYSALCSTTSGIRPALILPPNIWVRDDGFVVTNTEPSVPASISVPGSISGGSTITVSWGASTDPQNNLEGYIVERSTNGGSSWSQIYQGGARSTTNSVAFGTASVMYRVKAYDSGDLQSGYRTSGNVTVVNNNAPGAPGGINVPLTVVGGGQLLVSWGASSDSDNNLSGYALERSTNGGAYAEIFRGNALSYTDTITKGWLTVTYRVRAYDSYTAYSAYTTSAVRNVDNNTAPTIGCALSGDLGEKSAGFSIAYTVGDIDGDAVTVTEAIDGVEKRTFSVVLGEENIFEVTGEYFMCILNGRHTMTITATDAAGKSTILTLTFTKAVHRLRIYNTEPMDADATITKMVMAISRQIPADATFQVLVTNNARDESPVWEDATSVITTGLNYLFTNTVAANGNAFSFDITAERAPGGEGGYIKSIGGAFE